MCESDLRREKSRLLLCLSLSYHFSIFLLLLLLLISFFFSLRTVDTHRSFVLLGGHVTLVEILRKFPASGQQQDQRAIELVVKIFSSLLLSGSLPPTLAHSLTLALDHAIAHLFPHSIAEFGCIQRTR